MVTAFYGIIKLYPKQPETECYHAARSKRDQEGYG